MPNLLDGLMFLLLAGTAFWGWKSGILRQLVAISAAMVAFMVAEALYEPLGGIFNSFTSALAFFQGLAYLLLMTFTAAVWFVAIRRIYPYSRLGSDQTMRGLDSLGGMLLGLLLGLLLMIAIVGVGELLVYGRWPILESGGRRATVHNGMQNSLLVRTLFKEAPAFATYVGHWVPGVAIAREGRIEP